MVDEGSCSTLESAVERPTLSKTHRLGWEHMMLSLELSQKSDGKPDRESPCQDTCTEKKMLKIKNRNKALVLNQLKYPSTQGKKSRLNCRYETEKC